MGYHHDDDDHEDEEEDEDDDDGKQSLQHTAKVVSLNMTSWPWVQVTWEIDTMASRRGTRMSADDLLPSSRHDESHDPLEAVYDHDYGHNL